MPGEIAVEIGHEFVERDGKPRRGVEGSHVGHVALNQHDACSGEPRQCVCEDRFHLGIEVVPEVAARNAETQALEVDRRQTGWTASDDAVEQRAVGNAPRDRRRRIARV